MRKTIALLLAPFTPHLAEELWEKVGNKGFVSLEKWPVYDENKIDKKAEASELMVHKTISDINNVLGLIKVKEPKGIKLIVSGKWKYLMFKILKEEIKKTRVSLIIWRMLGQRLRRSSAVKL